MVETLQEFIGVRRFNARRGKYNVQQVIVTPPPPRPLNVFIVSELFRENADGPERHVQEFKGNRRECLRKKE